MKPANLSQKRKRYADIKTLKKAKPNRNQVNSTDSDNRLVNDASTSRYENHLIEIDVVHNEQSPIIEENNIIKDQIEVKALNITNIIPVNPSNTYYHNSPSGPNPQMIRPIAILIDDPNNIFLKILLLQH
ncbi:hypothetical protein RF11_09588 [Thelohanellus kitauei]|uniref:Uncharacterized protein n=1 Tax=Thelohanellus kitauei TaxID=669202 RepID=A0A0C2MKY6_THEKT|nr:hypothetical protein RF11_05309 [Thelohanellus kitauei]KII62271.1 hypothetical protein RF11_09588 [Thelohanellus kitauei]